MDEIWINSIGKRISLEEFKENYYQVGHVYKINDRNLQKCVGFADNERPIVEQIVILPNNGEDNFQFIKCKKEMAIPSLDFVNHILDGIYKEIPVELWDEIVETMNNTGESLIEKIRES